MEQKVYQYIKENHLIANGESVLLGVSGGADSICMLMVLNELKTKLQCSLAVVHVNHMLRGDAADKDSDFVEEVCRNLGIPFFMEKVDVRALAKEGGMSEEEAGRQARYDIFEKYRSKLPADKIAVAHNLNDQSETVLFNLFRGTGIKGLVGISVKREAIIRPLLCCSRTEIESYLKEKGLVYRVDETNNMTEYSRNKIRLEIIPFVKENINEQAEYNVVTAAEHLGEIADYLEGEVNQTFAQYVEEDQLMAQAFSLHPAILNGVLRKLIEAQAGKLKDITKIHIKAIRSLMEKETSKSVDLPYGLEAVRTYEGIKIRKKIEETDLKINQKVLEQGELFENEFVKISMEPDDFNLQNIPQLRYTKWFEYDKIEKLSVRNRMPGDYLVVDERGTRKKLKEYFINEKVPKEERDRLLLLTEGNHVLWIIGYRISSYYKVKECTKKVIRVDYLKDKGEDAKDER